MDRLIAFGDIHGCFHTIKELINQVNPTQRDALIFLGDYIDRGNMSYEVIDYLIDLSSQFNCVFLKGNHEDMLLKGLRDNDYENARIFMLNGGDATLKSYRKALDIKDARQSVFFEDFPQSHKDFFNNLKVSYEYENFFFVHAGIDPRYPLDDQVEEDMLWIRDDFLYYDGQVADGKIIVHGHTPMEPKNIKIYNDKYKDRINIDSACVFGYNLTCVDVLTNTKYTQKLRDLKV